MTSTYPKLLPPLDLSPQNIDETIANAVCTSCHTGPPWGAIYMQATHSSRTTSTRYGTWTVECWVCHNQHIQDQNRFNNSTYGKFIRRNINLANIKGADGNTFANLVNKELIPKSGIKPVVFKGQTGVNSFADGNPAAIDGICEVCHTQTSHWTNDGLNANRGIHENTGGTNCTAVCHKHIDGFFHGAGGTDCGDCHGHDNSYEGGTYSGSTQSHSTHTEHDDEPFGPPVLTCGYCHDTTKFPSFIYKPELDTDGNGKINLSETDACNDCHSEAGPFDGLNDPAVGAKKNWRNGVYTGTSLANGKERWCVTCHDSGTSVINGRQAPDIARNNAFSGYYASGHGAQSGDMGAGVRVIECGDCHDMTLSHNFDGKRSYTVAANNYQTGFRLRDVSWEWRGYDGETRIPLKIPEPNTTPGCQFVPHDNQLCFQCHSPEKLLGTSPAVGGTYVCDNTMVRDENNQDLSIQTGFSNHDNIHGYIKSGFTEVPSNIHWDHLVSVNSGFGNLWDSDKDGTRDSKATCITCHNPHGAAQADGITPTKRMTRLNLKIEWGSDIWGDYGKIGDTAQQQYICGTCHDDDPGIKYYRPAPAPILTEVNAFDFDATPALAHTGYTNNRTVRLTFTVSGATPTEMVIAEDAAFTKNVQGWMPYADTFDYTLTDCEETKTIFARVKNGVSNLSDIMSYSITLDTTLPSVTSAKVTSPIGGETWLQGSVHDITWEGITDTDTKVRISLMYSTDGGITFPGIIDPIEDNDGIYSWTVPAENSSSMQVQVLATDRAGNQATVDSTANFTVTP